MLVNLIKVARRNIWRFRQHYLLSAIGLFLGATVFLLLLHYTQPFLSFDGFHKDADRIVRLNSIINLPDQTNRYAATSFRIGPELAAAYPEINSTVRFRHMPVVVHYEDTRFDESTVLFADSTFLDVFSFALSRGIDADFLRDPSSIAITVDLATEYFRDENPIGKILQVEIQNEVRNLTIRAVMESPPENSSIQFSMVAPMQLIERAFGPGYGSLMPGHYTFFELKNDQQLDQLRSKLSAFVTTNLPDGLNEVMELELQPLRDLHFTHEYQFDLGRKSRKGALVGLLGLGFMTLLIAMVNFVNMSTALAIKRGKEMTVRKILGSSRLGVVQQLIVETAVMIMIVMLIAGLTVTALIPQLSKMVDFDFRLLSFWGLSFWIWLAVFSLLMVGMTGLYPAWTAARKSLTSGLQKIRIYSGRAFTLRHFILMFQITTAIFFLISAWVMVDQLVFMRNKNLGFDQNHVIQIGIGNPALRGKTFALKQQLAGLSSVSSVTSSTSGINGDHVQATFQLDEVGDASQLLMDINYVDADFMRTYGTTLLAGRTFAQDIPSDMQGALVLNESAATKFNLDPNEALGKVLSKITRDTMIATIIGVIGDYHSQSLHQEVAPMVWQIDSSSYQNVLAVKLKGDLDRAIEQVQQQWEHMQLGVPLDYEFLDESIALAYRSERQMARFVKIVTGILIFITCSGLYSMMLFIIEQKRSEIGIRKVLGASMNNLVVYLNKQNLLVLALGFMFGVPVALLAINQWLQQFAYRIEPQWYHFFGSGVICAFLALASVSFITYRAAQQDPVEVIREN